MYFKYYYNSKFKLALCGTNDLVLTGEFKPNTILLYRSINNIIVCCF